MIKITNRWLQRLCVCFFFLSVAGIIAYAPLAGANEEEVHIKKGPYDKYPETFSGRGIIEAISSDHVVIGDTEYKLSRGSSFNTPNQKNVSKSLFDKGQPVVFILNDEGEIQSIWKLKRLKDLMPI